MKKRSNGVGKVEKGKLMERKYKEKSDRPEMKG